MKSISTSPSPLAHPDVGDAAAPPARPTGDGRGSAYAEVRALLIVDCELVQEGLRRVLQERLGMQRIQFAGSLETPELPLGGPEAVDLIAVNLGVEAEAAWEALAALVEGFPKSKVVAISAADRREDLVAALAAGVHGFVPKRLPTADMAAAIAQVLAGDLYVPRRLSPSAPRPAPKDGVLAGESAGLTPRQREVLELMVHGLGARQIADRLGVAEGTAKIHLAAIYRALGVKNRAEAIATIARPALERLASRPAAA